MRKIKIISLLTLIPAICVAALWCYLHLYPAPKKDPHVIQLIEQYWKEGDQSLQKADYKGAIQAYEGALKAAEMIEDHRAMALLYANIGYCYTEMGDHLEGLACYLLSLKYFRKLKKADKRHDLHL